MSAELQMKEMSGSKSKDELLLIVRRLTFVRQPKLLSLPERRELKRALEALTCGDLLLATKLDRLAKSTRDLLNTIATITDKGAGFKVLDNPAMDATSAHGRLFGLMEGCC
jgi:DNA invertase Pin-like site-specific DNA recombinase